MFTALAAALLLGEAVAADLTVKSTREGSVVHITLDGELVGQTPQTLEDVSAGIHTLGFRSSTFAADAFTQQVDLPKKGEVTLVVDLERRKASVVGASPDKAASTPTATAPDASGAMGSVWVGTSMKDARVFINGKATGQKAPLIIEEMPVGEHTIELRTKCERGTKVVKVAKGKRQQVEIEGQAVPGLLEVTSSPAGAMVYVDDRAAGITPFVGEGLSCGTHQLDVRASGFLQSRQAIEVLGGETTTLSVTLSPEAFGQLLVEAPDGAVVLVDDIFVDKGVAKVPSISVGPHIVTIESDERGKVSGTIEIVADTEVKVTMDGLAGPSAATEPGEDAASSDHGTPAEAFEHSAARPAPTETSADRGGRLALDGIVTGGALVSAIYAGLEYKKTSDAYALFMEDPSSSYGQALYSTEVQPHKNRLYAGLAATALLGGTSILLWYGTDLSVGVAPTGVTLTAHW